MRIVGFIPAETVSAGIFEPPPEITKPEAPPEEPKKPSRRGKKKSEETENADNSAGILET